MPVERTARTPVAPKFPALMQAADGTIKLFVNEIDGVILRKADKNRESDELCESVGFIWAGTVAYRHNGTVVEGGRPIPASDSYWTRMDGFLTLSND